MVNCLNQKKNLVRHMLIKIEFSWDTVQLSQIVSDIYPLCCLGALEIRAMSFHLLPAVQSIKRSVRHSTYSKNNVWPLFFESPPPKIGEISYDIMHLIGKVIL